MPHQPVRSQLRKSTEHSSDEHVVKGELRRKGGSTWEC